MNDMTNLIVRVGIMLAALFSFAACGPHATVDTKAVIHPVDDAGGINHGGGHQCTPSCSGRACGSDGCGGSCGSGCASSQICNGSYQCQTPSTPDGTYCPSGIEYCHKIDAMNLQCFKLTGSASNGKCNAQTGNFDFLSSVDNVSHPYRNGAAMLECKSQTGATQWVLNPKNLHNQIGNDNPYEDWSCKLVSSGGGGNNGGGTPAGPGDIACYAERVDAGSWYALNGGGLTSTVAGDSTKANDPYSMLGMPTNNRVNFTVYAGQPGFCVLPEIELDKLWAYGSVKGQTGDQVVATFRVVCGSQTFLFQSSTPKCVNGNLDGIGSACLFSNAPQNDDRRFCGRNR